jgi:hypothetical protein
VTGRSGCLSAVSAAPVTAQVIITSVFMATPSSQCVPLSRLRLAATIVAPHGFFQPVATEI